MNKLDLVDCFYYWAKSKAIYTFIIVSLLNILLNDKYIVLILLSHH